jgi:hypothetical protein
METETTAPIYGVMLSGMDKSTRANGASNFSMPGRIAGIQGSPALRVDSVTVEMRNAIDATLNPDICEVRTQVEAFEYVGLDGNVHSHTPDIEVTYNTGLIEYWICKPAIVALEMNLPRWRDHVADQIVPDLVDDILIKTEQSVPPGRIDTNHLLHLALQRKPSPEVDLIVEFVRNAPAEVTIADVLPLLADRRSAFASTLQAIARKHLIINRDEAVSLKTALTLAEKKAA